VRVVVHAPQALRVDVAVHLRRRERAVAEELLDRPEVGAAPEEVRREGVAQPVRVRRDAAQRARVEATAARREEERVVGSLRQLGPRVAEVAREPVLRLLAERDDAVLATFAPADVDELLLEVDVAEVEGDCLGAP
jgi:hypothetical protein